MKDATTLLYALSTLAQTCAALAAFVGAVGIYRLQLLQASRNTIERNVRGLAAQTSLIGADVAALLPFDVVIDRVTNTDPGQGDQLIRAAAREALASWRGALHPITISTSMPRTDLHLQILRSTFSRSVTKLACFFLCDAR